jgi:hypothetical protein
MKFERDFRAWLESSLMDVPPDVKAFSFNLFEPAPVPDVKFGVELIGAGEFDENDPDWPCGEVWVPVQRQLDIPVSFSGEAWEECLTRIRSLLEEVLSEHSHAGKVLKSRAGIGLGFVDGDLEVIWKP